MEKEELPKGTKEEISLLQSQEAKNNEGKISNKSHIAQLQSFHDSQMTEKGSLENEEILLRGNIEKIGKKPIKGSENFQPSKETMDQETKRIQDKQQSIEEDFHQTPHLANTTIP